MQPLQQQASQFAASLHGFLRDELIDFLGLYFHTRGFFKLLLFSVHSFHRLFSHIVYFNLLIWNAWARSIDQSVSDTKFKARSVFFVSFSSNSFMLLATTRFPSSSGHRCTAALLLCQKHRTTISVTVSIYVESLRISRVVCLSSCSFDCWTMFVTTNLASSPVPLCQPKVAPGLPLPVTNQSWKLLQSTFTRSIFNRFCQRAWSFARRLYEATPCA